MRTLSKVVGTAVAIVLLTFVEAVAAKTELRLCTARKDGLYYVAGERIASAADGVGVRVSIVETAGSLYNLSALDARLCDAAIIQSDSLDWYKRSKAKNSTNLVNPLPLHKEFLHLICRRNAGFGNVSDLKALGSRGVVIIGEPGSGANITWKMLSNLKPQYAGVTAQQLGRSLTTRWLAENKAHCLVHVSGLGTEYVASMDKLDDQLQLISFDGEVLDGGAAQGVSNYQLSEIPADSYPGLQGDGAAATTINQTDAPQEPEHEEFQGGGTVTISVQAVIVFAKRWSDRHPNALKVMVSVVEQERPGILDLAYPPR